MPTGQLKQLQAEIVRQLLIDAGLVVLPPSASAWPAFVSYRPDKPDDCVVLFDTAGVKSSRNHITGEGIEYFGIEILLRSGVYRTGRLKVSDIAYHLDTNVAYTNVDITEESETFSYRVDVLNRQSGPFSLGKEQNADRYLFSVNYLAAIVSLN